MGRNGTEAQGKKKNCQRCYGAKGLFLSFHFSPILLGRRVTIGGWPALPAVIRYPKCVVMPVPLRSLADLIGRFTPREVVPPLSLKILENSQAQAWN
jgi:hypothetical protein